MVVGPKTALVVLADQANSGVLVLPTTTHPAARMPGHEGDVAGRRRSVGQQRRAERGAVADGVLVVLDGQRDAGQGPGITAGGDDLVDRGGLRQCPLAVHGDEGVVGGVEGLDPIERSLGQLPGADGAAADLTGQIGHGGGAEVHQVGSCPTAVAAAVAAEGESPATTWARSTPKGMTARAGTEMPLSI